MAEKTIPELEAITSIDDNSLFVVDTGIETFRINGANLALFIRESVLPAGIVQAFSGSVVPLGWLLAAGQAVSRTTYARLFAAIGTTFGIGDGSSTFNLPDARGRVLAGKDDMGGSAAGRLSSPAGPVDGSTLGATGGIQTYIPGGAISGTQSIAHTHAMLHTHTGPSHTHSGGAHRHNIAHSHIFMREAGEEMFARNAPSAGQTTVGSSASGTTSLAFGQGTFDPGLTRAARSSSTDRYYYTTGAIDPPDGDGLTAASGVGGTESTGASGTGVTSGASVSNTGGMSASATVNGSNFTFTGSASNKVQPTIVLNYIIKT